MSLPIFETNRLILRGVTLEDVPAYEKHFVDYEVIRHLSDVVPWPYPENGVSEFLENIVLPNQGRDQWMWGIYLRSNPQELIGAIDLRRNSRQENRGFWLSRQLWGNGYMPEALEPIMDHAFTKLGFEKMRFANAIGNVASRRVKEKTGARFLSVAPGKFVDPNYTSQEIWEISKNEYLDLRTQQELRNIPKKLFYFVRHGQTDANARELMSGGDWDLSLNEIGRVQASALAPKISSLSPKIERIVVSPMIRAQQTAELLNAEAQLPRSSREDFREWRVGEWEGLPWGDVPNPFLTDVDPPGGECRRTFELRLSRALRETLLEDERVPLIVAHGAVAHSLFTVLGVDKILIENCALYCVRPGEGSWALQRVF